MDAEPYGANRQRRSGSDAHVFSEWPGTGEARGFADSRSRSGQRVRPGAVRADEPAVSIGDDAASGLAELSSLAELGDPEGTREPGADASSCRPTRERCDGRDNDCDGRVDEVGALGCAVRFRDADGDSFGDAFVGCYCDPVPQTAENDLDCDDARVDVHPGSIELCDGDVDNDCDGYADLCGTSRHSVAAPGELVVSLVNEHTPGLPDELGEWFEIENHSALPVELMGLEVGDGRFDRFTVRRSVVVEPGDRARFGRNGDPETNGGLELDYVYSDFVLSSQGDMIELRSDGVVLDRVVYRAEGPLLPALP